jgi:hypothetical protein
MNDVTRGNTMIRIAASALALAAATLVASAPAEAAKCSCAKPHKARSHHRPKHRHHPVARRPVATPVVVASTETITTTKATVEAETYVSPESRYLPDPQHDDHPVWPANPREIAIASRLNATLDLWRTCSWRGQEEAAAAFVAWSRTHTVVDHHAMSSSDPIPAWKAFGRASAQHITFLDKTDENENGFNQQPMRCDVTQGERAEMRTDMDTQAHELAKTHATAHRPIR